MKRLLQNWLSTMVIVLLTKASFAQNSKASYTIRLRQFTIVPTENSQNFSMPIFDAQHKKWQGQQIAAIQFQELPSQAVLVQLQNAGIRLLDYLGGNAYTVSFAQAITPAQLQALQVRSVFDLPAVAKIDPSLLNGKAPLWARKQAGKTAITFQLTKGIDFAFQQQALKNEGVEIIEDKLIKYGLLQANVPNEKVLEICSLDFVAYAEPVPANDKILNYDARNLSRSNVLNAPAALGGRNLNGAGVAIGVGDDADPASHIDLKDRVINHAGYYQNYHGTHVSGTSSGAGLIRENTRGQASKSTVIAQIFAGIWLYADRYIADYGMVITNNSYGSVTGDEGYAGKYDAYSRLLDEQAFLYPELLHVFAAGNDGPYNYPLGWTPYPPGFANVLGGYQSAKNTISVGMMDKDLNMSPISSSGPTKDGRTKPEIATIGGAVRSTAPNNGYATDWGTSMAAPGVAGAAGLLYERYRQLNSGANPKSDLVKALLLCGANDYGNAGPDFKYGYGSMNALRSVELMEQNAYVQNTVTQGNTNSFTITVPAGTAQLKVFLYWHDPAAAPYVQKTLVNDLDLTVQAGASNYLPKKLDTLPNNVNVLAATGEDHINNNEQVVIDAPAAGTYTINVRGTAIAQNPNQRYVVVYDALPEGIRLYNPGYVSISPAENHLVTWDANGTGTTTFKLEYSIDNGSNWVLVNGNILANARQLAWTSPNVVTEFAKMRLTRNDNNNFSESPAFSIIERPNFFLSPNQCEGYIRIQWPAVNGATAYDVMMKKGDSMAVVATTTNLFYVFSGLNSEESYVISVRSRINNSVGIRANAAVVRANNNTGCVGSNLSDNDLRMEAILSPQSGRRLTAIEKTNNETLSLRIRNLDDQPANSFKVSYSINGATWVEQTVTTPIGGLSTYVHNFTGLNLSAIGNYQIRVAVKNDLADPITSNDTLTTMVKQLDNQAVLLPFEDNFDIATASTTAQASIGLPMLDRWDFNSNTVNGRIRTYAGFGVPFSGNRALTLDMSQFSSQPNTNQLTGTFNLLGYNTTQDIRLDFRFKQHNNIYDNGTNILEIRGGDGNTWINAYNLFANQAYKGTWRASASIELSDLLQAAGQNFSTSTQFRWGQYGYFPMGDETHNSGYSFDNVRLYIANDDIQLARVESPITSVCGLGSAAALQVRVYNSMNSARTNIPVKAVVDGGAVVTEIIPSINANDTITYTFSTLFNFSTIGYHSINTWVDMPNDNVRLNDSIVNYKFFNSPLINSFPYLQDFETADGFFYTNGQSSSWNYGVPASTRINSAASGSKVWKTNTNGNYNDEEDSYLYFPCFDVSGMTNPMLSMSMSMDLEQCPVDQGGPCDLAWMEYSNDGKVWTKLGSAGAGTNWYNQTTSNAWDTAGHVNWHVASTALPAGGNTLRLRMVLRSDGGVNREGIAIDDIHVFDRVNGIYEGAPASNAVVQNVSGNNKIDFLSSGNLVASILPNNQNLGSTTVQAFLHTAPVRDTNNQYYHDRNIIIQPTNINLVDSVTVRFYFLETETNRLLRATNCGTCSKPENAYRFGVTKYANSNDVLENGTLSDNIGGQYTFIPNGIVKTVPYDKGYYVEYKVKDFSEFWLNSGGANRNEPLPLHLLSFTAQKQADNNVLLQWTAGDDAGVQYEAQVAKGIKALQQGNFESLGFVNANAQSAYSLVDAAALKTGVRYYRLRMRAPNGDITYSKIVSLAFDAGLDWSIYPNPAVNQVNLLLQANKNQTIQIKLMNAQAQVLQQQQVYGTGDLQKHSINVQSLAAGSYLLQVTTAEGQQQLFKFVKK
jgi:subtilisin family serine protease